MASELLDAFRHGAWANRRLLEACRDLSPEQLAFNLPTGHGPALVTMKHLIGAESYYYAFVSGERLKLDWDEGRHETAESLLGFADDLANAWETLLAQPLDTARVISQQRSNGRVLQAKAGVMLAQALHHGNVHREQVSAILTHLGLTPPDISGWMYGESTGDLKR
jgi:uncharacterized damage-inducible protein DinB